MRSMIEGATRPVLCGVICALICAPAMALSPVQGEVGAVWWSSATETTSSGVGASTDVGTPGLRGDLWVLERYGVRAGQYRTQDAGMQSTSLDVLWRAFAPSANNFLAVGLGWQDMQLSGTDSGSATSGLRLAVEGHVGFTDLIQGYGQGAWLPSLSDSSGPTGQIQEVDGYEYEVGVAWSATPFMSVRAGWRESTVGFTETANVADISNTPPVQAQTIQSPQGGGLQSINPLDPSADSQGQLSPATWSSSGSGTTESKGWFFGLGFRF